MNEKLKILTGKKVKIAVIKTDNIGDAVLASPFFYELRKQFKKARITAFLSPQGKQVLDGLGVIDKIVAVKPKWLSYKKTPFFTRFSSAMKLVKIINAEKPDVLIGLRYKDRLSSLVLSLARAKLKIGYNVKGAGFGINYKIPLPSREIPETEKHFELLKKIKPGIKPKIKFGFSVDKLSEKTAQRVIKRHSMKRFIVVHPVSGHVSKDWEIGKYRELIKRLSRGIKVVIVGSRNDRSIYELKGKNIINLAGVLNIKELGSVIKRSEMVIGNDSAAVHIASAFNKKSLTIFSGAAKLSEWETLGKNAYKVTRTVHCTGCELLNCRYKDKHDCMDIPAEFVLKMISKIKNNKQKNRIEYYELH